MKLLRPLAAVIAITLAAPCTQAGTVGGAGVFIPVNPFDPDGDGVGSGSEASTTAFGVIGFGFGLTNPQNVRNIVRRYDGEENNLGGSRIQGQAFMGFHQVTAPAAFDVGTLITTHYIRQGYDAAQSYNLLLDGQSVQTGGGAVPSHLIRLTTLLDPLQGVSTVRVEQPMVTFNNTFGTRYADFGEALVFPDVMLPIPVSLVTASAPAGGSVIGSISGIHDGSNGLLEFDAGTPTGLWKVFNPAPDRFFQLDFAGSQPLRMLLLSAWTSLPVSGSVFDDTDSLIATFSADGGEWLPITFSQPVVTTGVRVTFDGAGAIGIREAIPLRLIPEPATVLMLTGLLMMLPRRRA